MDTPVEHGEQGEKGAVICSRDQCRARLSGSEGRVAA